MRVLFGIIVGIVLTVGAAFISDHWIFRSPATTGSDSAAIEHRNMVNWDVVGRNMRLVRQHARDGWTKLSHMIAS